jgi:hypothetical protein
MNGSVNKAARKILAFFVLCGSVLGGAVVADTAPAQAAIPPLYCGNVKSAMGGYFGDAQGPIYMCIATGDSKVWAGISAPDGSLLFSKGHAPLRVELTHFSFDQWPNGVAHVNPGLSFSQLIGPSSSRTSPIAWWWEGVYCARLYNMASGYAEDLVCIDTNGVPQRGSL